jgi:signal transduction histidine kinase
VAEIETINREVKWFAILLGMAGNILILIAGGAILYVDSIRMTESALKRASIAERKIINASEEAQQRIGRELHDDLGQQLTGIAFRSEILSQDLKKSGYSCCAEASEITVLINDAINKTRRLAQGLYPVELKGTGLSAMLEQLVENIESIYQIKSELVSEGECNIEDPVKLINLFRITQEAVNNAIKHSGATEIRIKMASTPANVTLAIIDNGRGIGERADASGRGVTGGLGMHTMQYRASFLGASFKVAQRPEGGTSVIVDIPNT